VELPVTVLVDRRGHPQIERVVDIVRGQAVLPDRFGERVLTVGVVDETPAELLEHAVTAVPDDVELTRVGDLQDPEHWSPAGGIGPNELPAPRVERLEAPGEAAVEELLVVVQVERVEVDAGPAVELLDPEDLAPPDRDGLAGDRLEGELVAGGPILGRGCLQDVSLDPPSHI